MHRRYCTAHPAHAEGRLTGSPTAGFLADDRCRKLPIALVSIIGGSSRPMPDCGAIGVVGKSDSKVRLRAESSHFGRIRSQLSRRAVLSGLRQLLSRWIPDSWRGQGFWASYERRAALFPWVSLNSSQISRQERPCARRMAIQAASTTTRSLPRLLPLARKAP